MLDLETGVVTIQRYGMYSISFHGIPCYKVQKTGIRVKQKYKESFTNMLLETHTMNGNNSLYVMKLVDLKTGDQIRLKFWIGDDKNSNIYSYVGHNKYIELKFFTGILVEPFE